MKNNSSWKRIQGFLIIVLKIVGTFIVLVVAYGLAILLTDGYSQGKLAVSIGVVITFLVFYFFWKRRWIPVLALYPFAATMLLMIAFMVYTIVPVASTHKHQKIPDFTGVKTQYWKLTTGSIIAYYKLSANQVAAKKPFPIVFLHGGPGAYVKQLDIDFFSSFTNEGYDVYLYDQAGSGRSGLLRKTEYSHQRNVTDCNAILDVIGAKKYIVIGLSYGGSLLASISADKNIAFKIDRAIYAEPGVSIVPSQDPILPRSPNAGKENVGIPLRLFIGILLNPKGDFTSQTEVINYFFEKKGLIQKFFQSAYPLKDTVRIPKVGLNALNFAMNGIVAPEVNDYNAALARDFKLQHVRSMLMMGESSYVDRNGPLDLLKINPDMERVQYFKNAGHLLWNGLDNNNQLVKRAIDEFLNDQPPSIPNYPKLKDIGEFVRERK